MKQLAINRCLTEESKIKMIHVYGRDYALHAQRDELIVTDKKDYSAIYAVISMDLCLWQARKEQP